MTYEIVHKTTYTYKTPVSVGNHVVCLTPRSLPHHRCESHELAVTPTPAETSGRLNYFGNAVTFFTIREPHRELEIESRSRVAIDGQSTAWPERSLPWEDVARALRADLSPAGLDAYQFVFESPRVKPSYEFAMYASRSFSKARPLAD